MPPSDLYKKFRESSDEKPEWNKKPKPKDGSHCPGCGLANYQGLCPHCRGDKEEFDELFN